MMVSQHSVGRACTPTEHLTGQLRAHCFKASQRAPRFQPRAQAFWPFRKAATTDSKQKISEAKAKLTQLAGKKYGQDLKQNQKEDIRDVLKELEAFESGNMRKKELAGSDWDLLYTESTGSSGGKVGPFVGQVQQANCCWIACADTPAHEP